MTAPGGPRLPATGGAHRSRPGDGAGVSYVGVSQSWSSAGIHAGGWPCPLACALIAASRPPHNRARRRSCALIATMIVLSDMSTAPTAGDNTIPHGASTPAASGIATTL